MRLQMPNLQTVEPLANPPIVEVACGCIFPPLAALDATLVGIYWNERRQQDYPRHELHPAIAGQPTSLSNQLSFTVQEGVPPVRTWLVSQNEEFIVQIQSDRFYVNWRKRAGRYPRFTPDNGVKALTLSEFDRFRAFCAREFGQEPQPLQAQLTKVDHIIERERWANFAQLAEMVPWLETFNKFSHSGDPQIAMRFMEEREGGHLIVALDMLPPFATNPPAPGRILKIEATATKAVPGTHALPAVFDRVNLEVNDVFGKLVPQPTRTKYFQGKREG